MIRHLYIRDFVLIHELTLDFRDGFSAFIGETGAGKSIFIDALSVLCADRAGSSFVSKGASKAIVEGTFALGNDEHAVQALTDAGFDVGEETTFTREIASSGKSTARIDHRIVTLSLVKDVLKNQMDIHGQRDSQYLLNPSVHVHLLDKYLQDDEILRKTEEAYQNWKVLVDEKEDALKQQYSKEDEEYFRYQIQEIQSAGLKEGEEEDLESKERSFRAVKNSLEKLNRIISSWDEQISEPLYEMNKLVQGLDDSDALRPVQSTVNDSYYALNDAMEQLRSSLDDMDLSEDDINAMEERLFTIQRLKRKYGGSVADILAHQKDLEGKIERMSDREHYLKKMDEKIAEALKAYNESAGELSRVRRDGAPKLDAAIAAHLKDLILPNARFHTEIKDTGRPTMAGSDAVEFLISMNKGEDLKPLAKTASGGELSRLMLGLKAEFSRLQGIETVIFDEIDTGVSGPVASAIGRKMQAIARDCQVFSVTHLAPVAACAKQDYLVYKEEDDGRTITHVKEIKGSALIDQLALIASGEVTKSSRAAAKELYQRSQS